MYNIPCGVKTNTKHQAGDYMKKLFFTTAILIYTFFVTAVVFDNAAHSSKQSVRTVRAVEVYETTQPQTEAKYIVTALDGRVAVSESDSGRIIRRTDTQVALLPESDRKRLEKGIRVKTERELRQLLEDICS